MVKHSAFEIDIRDRFHQGFTCSFCMRGAQKHKKDSQVVSLFTLSGSMSVKAEHKYVGENSGTAIIKHDLGFECNYFSYKIVCRKKLSFF